MLNVIGLFWYVAAPGGSRKDLAEQSEQIRREIAGTRQRAVRLKSIANKVQLGSTESADFEARYFLPKRIAYESVIEEIQRMAKASGLQEREAVYTEEPIEGSDDLSLLNATANYEGSYDNLMRFLHEADRSRMLLMLDNLQAAPQQRGGQISTQIRFQSIIHEYAPSTAGGQQ
jgi:Tfp pilus assembly protein PilO